MKSLDRMIKETMPEFYMTPNIIYEYEPRDYSCSGMVVLISGGSFDGRCAPMYVGLVNLSNFKSHLFVYEVDVVGPNHKVEYSIAAEVAREDSFILHRDALSFANLKQIDPLVCLAIGDMVSFHLVSSASLGTYFAYPWITDFSYSASDIRDDMLNGKKLLKTKMKLSGEWKDIEGNDYDPNKPSKDLSLGSGYLIKKLSFCEIIFP